MRRLGIPPLWLWLIAIIYVGIGPDIFGWLMGPIGYWIGLVMGIGLFLTFGWAWAATRDDSGGD